jgi:phosphoribosylcarboxyaminoimidazole (NCAIR) mutase
MAIGKAGATNAAIFAAEVLAGSDDRLAERLVQFKADQARKVQEKDSRLQGEL